MIVFDASALVSAAIRSDSTPERALLRAQDNDVFALSTAVDAEVAEVLNRPKFANAISAARRLQITAILRDSAVWFEPIIRVTDCRDAKDNKYLELALASGAATIVSGDLDLLVLHPWRNVNILRPANYLSIVQSNK